MQRWSLWPLTATLCTLGLFSSAAQAQFKEPDKVKIGFITDMSSLYADVEGKHGATAIQMAIDDFGGKVLGKPGSAEAAVGQLREMAGRSHTFYTGVTVYDSLSREVSTDVVTFTVTLRRLSREQLVRYVKRENPVDCAGSFKIEGLGIALMERMEGSDYTALIGLPLIRLTAMLEQFGVEIL